MHFVQLCVIELKVGMGVGHGPTKFESKGHPEVKLLWGQSGVQYWGQRSYRSQPRSTRGQIAQECLMDTIW